MLLVLVWAELVQALRTKEVWYFLLCPAAVAIPATLGLAQLLTSAMAAPRVAVLPGLALDLSEVAEDNWISTLEVDDVRRAVEEGEAMWGVLALHELDGAEGTRWRAEILGRGDVGAIRNVIDAAAMADFEGRVEAAGGTRTDWQPASVRIEKSSSGPKAMEWPRFLFSCMATALTMVALLVLPMQVISDRQAGVLESLAATRSSLGAQWLSRALTMALVQLLALLLFLTSVAGISLSLGTASLPDLSMVAAVGVVVVVSNCWLVGLGLWCPTVVSAFNSSVGLMGLVGLTIFWSPPWWLPVIGPLGAQGWQVGASAIVSLLVTTLAVYLGVYFLPENRLFPEQGGRK